MYTRAAKAYADVDLGSMPKTQVVERLFDRFARDAEAARKAIVARDIPAKAAAIDHATQIVVQLRVALDHSVAPELSANLDALYQYVIERLAEANLRLNVAPLDAGAKVMADIGGAFRRAHAEAR
jgi:flagellar protein FliS